MRTAYGPDAGVVPPRDGERHRPHPRRRGIERDVTFAEADGVAGEDIDAAYEAKYGRYGKGVVKTVVGEQVYPLTIRLVPRDA